MSSRNMKNLRKEKDTTFVVSFSWRGAMRLGRMPPHPEHIGDIMLTFRSIRMWKNICEALHDETTAPNKIGAAVFTMHLVI